MNELELILLTGAGLLVCLWEGCCDLRAMVDLTAKPGAAKIKEVGIKVD